MTETRENKMTVTTIVLIGLMTAVTCILAPISIPLPGGVPISLTNLVVYLSVFLLGWKWGTLSYLVYMLLGMAGLPVFSNFSGGMAKLAGPTGGYIIGFILMAIICGIFFEKFRGKRMMYVAGMVLGTLVAYAFGTVWFMYQMEMGLWASLAACVFPFLIGDGVKIGIVTIIGPMIRRRLSKTGMMVNK